MLKALLIFTVLYNVISTSDSRIHHLVLKNEVRHYFVVSTFGFFRGGSLKVSAENITFALSSVSAEAGLTDSNVFGFSFARTASNSLTPYLESHPESCLLLDEGARNDENVNLVSFVVNPKLSALLVNCSRNFNLNVTPLKEDIPHVQGSISRQRRSLDELTSDSFLMAKRRKRDATVNPIETKNHVPAGASPDGPKKEGAKDPAPVGATLDGPKKEGAKVPAPVGNTPDDPKKEGAKDPDTQHHSCSSVQIPLSSVQDEYSYHFSFKFEVDIEEEDQEGLYSLYFHNCASYKGTDLHPVNLSISIEEKNEHSFLSSGEIPLTTLFFVMSVVFFATGCCWIYCLKKKREETYKIHYLMGLLVFVKSLSLLFHGINYYFIAEYGYHIETWAIMYYITHLLKGALLFITIILIGTGWAFIKHILSDKDKKIFMIVIPLQVLANVAEIIMEESEEGETQHNTWREVFIMVDLLCCGAILFPVVWSIRHLQDASLTDGKAAFNLEKLKLFRHFYVLIVCYIYFTRIIVFLLKITVPVQYEWLDEFFREAATLVFFAITGYKFRPVQNNPYFSLPQEEDLEMEEVVTQPGLMETVHKTHRQPEHSDSQDCVKRESSHEYD